MTGHAISALLASGAASLVEFVEALTVILAVGAVRGWRPAVAGGGAAVVMLIVLVGLLGPALLRLPVAPVQVVFGMLLVLLGSRWLRKATRRAAGILPLRDEAAAFVRHRDRMEARHSAAAASVAFQATAVEGLEVVFIVIAVGAGGPGLLWPAMVGAGGALAVVLALGVLLRRPIARVPENTLKRVVGGVLCGFGTFWVGEGAGLSWPGGEGWVVVLVAGYLALSWGMAAWLRAS